LVYKALFSDITPEKIREEALDPQKANWVIGALMSLSPDFNQKYLQEPLLRNLMSIWTNAQHVSSNSEEYYKARIKRDRGAGNIIYTRMNSEQVKTTTSDYKLTLAFTNLKYEDLAKEDEEEKLLFEYQEVFGLIGSQTCVLKLESNDNGTKILGRTHDGNPIWVNKVICSIYDFDRMYNKGPLFVFKVSARSLFDSEVQHHKNIYWGVNDLKDIPNSVPYGIMLIRNFFHSRVGDTAGHVKENIVD